MSSTSDRHNKQLREQSFRKNIRHPPCILSILRRGPPSDMTYGQACTILARYTIAKGLTEAHGEEMVQTMLRNAISSRTREPEADQKFVRCLSLEKESHRACIWNCGDILSSKKLRERGACAGWHCEYYSADLDWRPHHQCSEQEAQLEKDLLTYVLQNLEGTEEGLRLRGLSEGFIDEHTCRQGTRLLLNRMLWHVCRYFTNHSKEIRVSALLALLTRNPQIQPHSKEIARYAQYLAGRSPCQHDTFVGYLKRVKERGIQLRTQELIHHADTALRTSIVPPDIVLQTLRNQSNSLLFAADDATHTLREDLDDVVRVMFTKRSAVIPTPSAWLNRALGGGWQQGRVYVAYASCDKEATDFAAWCADYAAQQRFPTLYVSFDTSREDLWISALVRHSGVGINELSSYRRHAFDSEAAVTIQERVIQAGERLSERVAQHLIVVEADEEMTTVDIERAARAVQNQTGANEDRLMLLLFDHLQKTSSADRSGQEGDRKDALDELLTLARLKTLTRGAKVAIVIAVANATPSEFVSGESTSYPASYAADYTLWLHSDLVEVQGPGREKDVDQLHLAREWYKRRYPRHRRYIEDCFDELRADRPLDETSCTYTRLSLFKRGARMLANPVILYAGASRVFRTLSTEPTDLEKR